jgi:hypothetical protein
LPQPVISAVRFANPRFRQASSPRSLDPLQIEVRIDSPRAATAWLTANVSDELGNKLVNADPCEEDDKEEMVQLPKGTSEWRFDIDCLYLQPGPYVIDVWLANTRGDTLDFRPMAVRMDVLDPHGRPADPTRAVQDGGLVACTFSLSRSDADRTLRRAR